MTKANGLDLSITSPGWYCAIPELQLWNDQKLWRDHMNQLMLEKGNSNFDGSAKYAFIIRRKHFPEVAMIKKISGVYSQQSKMYEESSTSWLLDVLVATRPDVWCSCSAFQQPRNRETIHIIKERLGHVIGYWGENHVSLIIIVYFSEEITPNIFLRRTF